jgi:hypothetical protein
MPNTTSIDPLIVREVLHSVHHGNNKAAFCSGFVITNKPSDGLEPSTPSLPCAPNGNRLQPMATVIACPGAFRANPICHPLPPVATTGLHKGSI